MPTRHRLRSTVLVRLLGLVLFATGYAAAAADAPPPAAFELVALGVHGGLSDGNLSAYAVRALDQPRYLLLDAGSVLPGVERALAQGGFAHSPPPAGEPLGAAGYVYRQAIAAYFISHAHLDHVEGLLIAATDDVGPKPVYGLAGTLDALSRDYFNWTAWPNFADRGEPPALGRYRLTAEPVGQAFAVAGTGLQGAVYPLQHDRVVSSAIVLQRQGQYLAYLGDTGPDEVQHSDKLAALWRQLAPLIRQHRLHALMIEVSYPDGVPDGQLFGHLTPAWLLRELHALADEAGGRQALAGLRVIVTHTKPSLLRDHDPRAQVTQQLNAGNDLGVHFEMLLQGQTEKI